MAPNLPTVVGEVFRTCYEAIRRGELIRRQDLRDKEFHFQDWFAHRLTDLAVNYEISGRNQYPDFTLVHSPIGFEVKGLRYPGRVASYDSNSQVPKGRHNGREIFYVFGRYPSEPLREQEYPVHDLLVCHGSFLNADTDYVHENKSVRGFGSYGDILIRDRKMYVSPTPFALTQNTEGQITLLLPENYPAGDELVARGALVRIQARELVVGYEFNLQTNSITARYIANPNAGREHRFVAYRVLAEPGPEVRMAM